MNTLGLVMASMGEDPLAEHQRAVAAVEQMLPLERYAETWAAILHYHPEQELEVLARLGVDAASWGEIDLRWTDVLQCRGYSIDETLSLRFTRALMRKRHELRQKNPKIRKLGQLPKAKPEPVPGAETGASVAEPASVPASPMEAPTFMRAETPRTDAPDADVPRMDVPRTSPRPPSSPLEGLSLVAALPLVSSPPALIAPGRAPASAGMSTETASIDLSVLLKQAVPFDPLAPSKLPPPSPAIRPVDPGIGYSDETTELNFADILKMGAPVPFGARQAPPGTAEVPKTEMSAQKRRLVRFDPQTGAPLAVPRWEDLPATEAKK